MRSPRRLGLVMAFLALLGVVPLTALVVVKLHGPQIEREAFANLKAIAELKSSQLENWLSERYNDSVVLMSSEVLLRRAAALQRSDEKPLRDAVRDSLNSAVDQVQYESAMLIDPEGRSLVALGRVSLVEAEIIKILPKAFATGLPQFSEFIADEDGGIRLGFVVPLIHFDHDVRQPLGAVVLHVRPDAFLFPYIQSWPTSSASGETLLVRRDGETLLYLNQLRHHQGPALSLRLPMARTELLGVKAVQEAQNGEGEGIDYRGVRVFAAYRPVADTGWMIISKMDRDEVLAPLHDLAFWVGLIAFLAVVSLSGVMLLLWRQRQRVYDLRVQAQSDRLLRSFYDLPFIGIAMSSPNSKHWIQCNDRLCEILGYTREEMMSMTWAEMTHPDDLAENMSKIDQVSRGEADGYVLEKRFLHKDGSTVYALLDVKCVRNIEGELEYNFATVQDITERKLADAKIERLSKIYMALSECNQAIVRSTCQEELFPLICRSAVLHGGMKLARISLIDHDSRVLRTVASFGEEIVHLGEVPVSADAEHPYGRGGTGTALREGRPVWVQDFVNDPITAPWHDRGVLEGWRSSAALPLTRNGVVIGALRLYSGELNAFDESIRNLLTEMATDISFALGLFAREAERMKAQEQLRFSATVFEHSVEMVVITDALHRILMVNPAFTTLTGYSADEVVGQNTRMLSSGVHDAHFFQFVWDTVRSVGHWQGELWNRRKDGDVFPQLLSISQVLDEQGVVSHYVVVASDISEHKASQEHIQKLAHFDALTGLPNRSLLADRVAQAISRMDRNNQSLALVFLDLDRFKNVNDSLGHRVGDQLLIQVAERLKSALRDEDTVSRLGGDEFIMVLPGANADGATHVVEKVLKTLSRPYSIEPHELTITPSLGIAMYPLDGDSYETLSMCADAAMYRAKQSGRHTYRFFTREMQERSERTLQLENALRRVLENNQLQLYFQPQIALISNRVIGVEALLRWTHPELGAVSPADFIPVAEDSGLILPIGEWVLRAAVAQMKEWIDSGMKPMVMAVNLSAVQFRQADLPLLVSNVLDEFDLPAKYLELELTEGVAMEDPLAAIEMMNLLHERGIRLSIDDFGTGYSSLSYLKRFKVYKLKIDKSFVRDISRDPEDEAIVDAIIGLSRSLGLQTIAEGVETAEQLAFLRSKGCDEVQGYYFGKPMPAVEFEAFLRDYRPARL
ncbi:MAG: EAL domain-containing protein [Betaproteobacteria bacterium]